MIPGNSEFSVAAAAVVVEAVTEALGGLWVAMTPLPESVATGAEGNGSTLDSGDNQDGVLGSAILLSNDKERYHREREREREKDHCHDSQQGSNCINHSYSFAVQRRRENETTVARTVYG